MTQIINMEKMTQLSACISQMRQIDDFYFPMLQNSPILRSGLNYSVSLGGTKVRKYVHIPKWKRALDMIKRLPLKFAKKKPQFKWYITEVAIK